MPERSWTTIPIGEVVTEIEKRAVSFAPSDRVETVGVRWYGMGLFTKTAMRSEIKGEKLYALVPGSLIYNKLFAWKQSFGVVTDDYADVVASSEFPQFEVDHDRVSPEFLALYCASPIFAREAGFASDGATATSRNRLKVDDFLGLPLVLPSPSEQERIVGAMRAVDAALMATENEADQLARVLLARREVLTNDESHPEATGERAFDIKLGRQKAPKYASGTSMTKYLRSANVGHDELRLADVFEMNFDEKERKAYALRAGDVLVSEGSAGAEAVGMPAAWNDEIESPVCFQNTLLRYRARDGVTTPEFVRHWCLWAYESGAFKRVCPPGVNILHIGATRAKAMKLRLPDLQSQQSIVAELEPLTQAVASLRSEAAHLRRAREALLDALLTGKVEVSIPPEDGDALA